MEDRAPRCGPSSFSLILRHVRARLMDFRDREQARAAYGYEPTREAAMGAFESWRKTRGGGIPN